MAKSYRTERDISDYSGLSDISHVYQIPDTYIGGAKPQAHKAWLLEEDKLVEKEITLPEGVQRVFLEILSNAGDNCDASRRAGVNPDRIDVVASEEEITITNYGLHIPVKKISIIEDKGNKKVLEYQEDIDQSYWLPAFIFGVFRSSNNYDKGVKRMGCGRNGFGSKLTNIFSNLFTVTVEDPDNHLRFTGTWKDNMFMHNPNEKPDIKVSEDKSIKKGKVSVTWRLDFERFGMLSYSQEDLNLFARYTADFSFACKIKTSFNGKEYDYRNILDYASLVWDSKDLEKNITKYSWGDNPPADLMNLSVKAQEKKILEAKNPDHIPELEILILDTPDKGQILSYVNGLLTREGGVHVDAVLDPVCKYIANIINGGKKKKKATGATITAKNIKSHLSFIINARVADPEYNSQSKTRLTAPNVNLALTAQNMKKIQDWDVLSRLYAELEAIAFKSAANSDGKKRKHVVMDKGEDANLAGTKESLKCKLYLVEGNSAANYPQKRICMIEGGKDYNGYMPLKGKFLNVTRAKPSQYADNAVIATIKQILGLREEVDYSLEHNLQQLRYGFIILNVDADCFTRDTPILIRKEKEVDITSFDNLFNQYDNTAGCALVDDIEIWSQKGWTKLKAIVAKESNKKIVTINTPCGLFRCTEDHQLILEDGSAIRAKDIKVGHKLMRTKRIENYDNIISTEQDYLVKKLQCYKAGKKKEDISKAINYELKFCQSLVLNKYNYGLDEEEAWFWGFFFAEGTCGVYIYSIDRAKKTQLNTEKSRKRWRNWINKYQEEIKLLEQEKYNLITNNSPCGIINNKIKIKKKQLSNAIINSQRISKEKTNNVMRTNYSFSISNCDKSLLEKAKTIVEEKYSQYDWSLVSVKVREDCTPAYRLILNGGIKTKSFILDMRNKFYDLDKFKKVPKEILNNHTNIQKSFYQGYYDAEGFRYLKKTKNAEGFDILGQVGAQGMCFLLERLGYCVNIKEKNNKPNVFTIHASQKFRRLHPGQVTRVYETNYQDLVYDVETENHTLNAGIGGLVQHNCDGSHIMAIVLNFFREKFPQLLTQNMIGYLRTPIVKIMKNGKILQRFFAQSDFDQWMKKNYPNGLPKSLYARYYKGLGTSNDDDIADDISHAPTLICFYDSQCTGNFDLAFHKDNTHRRKEWIEKWRDATQYEDIISVDINDMIKGRKHFDKYNLKLLQAQDISQFINRELVSYSVASLFRAIPSEYDHLKESQRKALWSALEYFHYDPKKGKSIKVGRFANKAADMSQYHHGEKSLIDTFIKMAQDFIGSNNMGYFKKDGQFGTRADGGDNAADARYSETHLAWWIPFVYYRESIDLVPKRLVDDEETEPLWLPGVIPMGIVNGTNGIATAFSTTTPCHNPLDLIAWYRAKCKGQESKAIIPWYNGFKGKMKIVNRDQNKDDLAAELLPADINKERPITGSPIRAKDLEEDEFEQLEHENMAVLNNIRDSKLTLKTFGKYSIEGFHKNDGPIIKISELPIGTWIHRYRKWLELLVQQKGKERPVYDFKDNSTTEEANFVIHWNSRYRTPNEVNLKLIRSIGLSNITLIDHRGFPSKYASIQEVMERYYEHMITHYEQVRQNRIKIEENREKDISYRMKFIVHVLKGDIKIIKVKEEIVKEKMKSFDIPFEYYDKSKSRDFSEESLAKYKTQLEEARARAKAARETKAQDIWLSKLDILEKELRKRYKYKKFDMRK